MNYHKSADVVATFCRLVWQNNAFLLKNLFRSYIRGFSTQSNYYRPAHKVASGRASKGHGKPWASIPANVLDYKSPAFFFFSALFKRRHTRFFFQGRVKGPARSSLNLMKTYFVSLEPFHTPFLPQSLYSYAKKTQAKFYEFLLFAICQNCLKILG